MEGPWDSEAWLRHNGLVLDSGTQSPASLGRLIHLSRASLRVTGAGAQPSCDPTMDPAEGLGRSARSVRSLEWMK